MELGVTTTPTHGWAVGTTGTILNTADGGTTWTAQASGTGAHLYGVAFTDALTGWAVGGSGAILHTANGGATWNPQASGTGAYLFGVAFTDALTGWAVGRNGTILHTANGGATWNPQASGTIVILWDVDFIPGGTTVDTTITFPSTGYRVDSWGTVSREGNTFRADATVYRWTGPAAMRINKVGNMYELGSLSPGSYTFELYANGSLVKSTAFAVGSSLRDVAITGIKVRGTPRVGRRAAVSITVENQGEATESFTVELSANGKLVGEARVRRLAPGKSRRLALRWIPGEGGDYVLTARVHPGDVPDDRDTADRSAQAGVTARL